MLFTEAQEDAWMVGIMASKRHLKKGKNVVPENEYALYEKSSLNDSHILIDI